MKPKKIPQYNKVGIPIIATSPAGQRSVDRALAKTREKVEEAASHDAVVSGGIHNDR